MSSQLDPKYMELAIEEAKKNFISGNGGPFGAVIVKNNEMVSFAANSVLLGDSTAHAEINAIRMACSKLQTHDLSGCIIYSTTEPCPMCFSAIHWAKIEKIVYGTNIQDVARLGFNELSISSQQMKQLGSIGIEIVADYLRDQCLEMLNQWNNLSIKKIY